MRQWGRTPGPPSPPSTHLVAEVGLGQAVPIHDIVKIVQRFAENLVLLLASDGKGLLGWEAPCVWLCLEGAERGGLALVLADMGRTPTRTAAAPEKPHNPSSICFWLDTEEAPNIQLRVSASAPTCKQCRKIGDVDRVL